LNTAFTERFELVGRPLGNRTSTFSPGQGLDPAIIAFMPYRNHDNAALNACIGAATLAAAGVAAAAA